MPDIHYMLDALIQILDNFLQKNSQMILFYFFWSETVSNLETLHPLSVQMLRQRTKANASGSITTTIGARLLTSSVSANVPNIKPPD